VTHQHVNRNAAASFSTVVVRCGKGKRAATALAHQVPLSETSLSSLAAGQDHFLRKVP
jgi:hypothetical protein